MTSACRSPSASCRSVCSHWREAARLRLTAPTARHGAPAARAVRKTGALAARIRRPAPQPVPPHARHVVRSQACFRDRATGALWPWRWSCSAPAHRHCPPRRCRRSPMRCTPGPAATIRPPSMRGCTITCSAPLRLWRGCSRSTARARCPTRCGPTTPPSTSSLSPRCSRACCTALERPARCATRRRRSPRRRTPRSPRWCSNQPVYRALAALPTPRDAATRHYLEHTLLEYRLAGVDKNDATRAKIKALQDKITELGLKFERAVHDDVHTVVVDKEQLAGLPPDYLAAHPPDAQGHVKITTDPPDAWPARRFADNSELRHKLFLASQSVAYPANTETLRGLLQARADLAQLLGYASWADFAMADQMMGSPAKLARFPRERRRGLARRGEARGCGAARLRAHARCVAAADRCRRRTLLAGTVPARQVQLRFAERASLLPLRRGRARRDRHRGAAVSRRHPRSTRRAHLAPVGHHLRRVRGRHEARPHLPRHAPARRQGQVVLDAAARRRACSRASFRKARWYATSPAAAAPIPGSCNTATW